VNNTTDYDSYLQLQNLSADILKTRRHKDRNTDDTKKDNRTDSANEATATAHANSSETALMVIDWISKIPVSICITGTMTDVKVAPCHT
jgi:hypothetical protein